MMSTTSAHFS